MIKILDDWVYSRRNERLSPQQKRIVCEAWNDKKYGEMEVPGYSLRTVKTIVAPNLWKLLSMVVGDKVGKKNLKLVLEPALERRSQQLARQQSKTASVGNNIVSENTNSPQELEWGTIDWERRHRNFWMFTDGMRI